MVAALVVVSSPAHLWSQEWTRFRGPNGSGESEAAGIPAKWTDSDYNWKVALPGVGHGSPVVWGDKIFLLSADPKTATRHVLCLSAADGKIVWQRDYPSATHHLHTRSSYASCTPTVDADRVYVAWSDPEHTTLLALDHSGKDAWSLDLGPWVSQHGFGTSPMLYKDLCIVTSYHENPKRPNAGEPSLAFVAAVDKAKGSVRWKTDRKVDTTSYSVPCVRPTGNGGEELVFLSTAEGMFGLNPQDGKERWSLPVFTMRTVSSPVLAGGLIFGTTGSGGGGNYVVAVKPGEKPEVAYEVRKEAPYVPTPVAHGELVFLWSDKGIVTCIQAADGKQVWQKRVPGNYSGSPIRVRDKLYCIDEAGTVVVIGAGKEFQEFGSMPLGEESRATPAVSGGRMYLRTTSHLASIGGKST
jgi:outer membrane protein assembly factor BamB